MDESDTLEMDRNSFVEDFFGKSKNRTNLQRSLGFWDGLNVIICIMIGSGVFASPGTALDYAGASGTALLSWAIAGVFLTSLWNSNPCCFRRYCSNCVLLLC
jgi:amino acid permease